MSKNETDMLFVTNAEKDITNRCVKTLLQSHFSTFKKKKKIYILYTSMVAYSAGGTCWRRGVTSAKVNWQLCNKSFELLALASRQSPVHYHRRKTCNKVQCFFARCKAARAALSVRYLKTVVEVVCCLLPLVW